MTYIITGQKRRNLKSKLNKRIKTLNKINSLEQKNKLNISIELTKRYLQLTVNDLKDHHYDY